MRVKTGVFATIVVCAGCLASISATANASIIQVGAGLSSVNTPVAFEAQLSISGNTLTIILRNNSTQSLAPNDLLAGYYFDIVKDGARPTLSLVSVSGDVYVGSDDSPDQLQTPQPDLMASDTNRGPWEFKVMTPTANPFLGFGLGTAGNSNLSPNGFNGNVVDGFDYGIYVADVTTQNMDATFLVKNQLTFTFSGVSGFSESDISSKYAFTMGTAPDSLMTPEPATLTLLVLGGLFVIRRRTRQR